MQPAVDHRPAPPAVLAYGRVRFTDARLGPVLRGLAADEVLVALVWATDAVTWEQAAAGAGRPGEVGERVRRKLKRLGARYTERAAAAGGIRR